MDALAAALQDSALSQLLRSSIWLYPLVNTGHVVGIALLFGAIVPLDLRLLGFFQRTPLEHLLNTLIPVAITGLVLALLTGSLLFATRPLDYVGEPLFGIKLVLLGAGVVNALVLRYSPSWKWVGGATGAPPPRAWRLHGLLSIVLWLGVITAGRLIGYR
ncbi:MAG: hypothetical protein Q8S96_04880 [Hydrogenophaga sp.]|uniref:hypothetical protein n=1 Tax=Hydrogenophaga sp. TaxID=1904254 RepID=UPI00271FB501|nr:hypothetical protein [Hydrogenophaga sp.]MDO9481467.1 hypothetical protein [Hydrogenophaga sp.]MDP3343778.1 hypothetical protein [Hydrogenophaga sp.]MDP3808531.1 hypothetical protein [Hydrogenophaga sp.]